MDVVEVLLNLETGAWEAGSALDAAWYRENVTDDALFVFPGMTDTLSKHETIEAVESAAAGWQSYEIVDPQCVRLTPDSAVLTYLATATREGDIHPYIARISSVYVERGGGWKLAFHQQTPAEQDEPALSLEGAATASIVI